MRNPPLTLALVLISGGLFAQEKPAPVAGPAPQLLPQKADDALVSVVSEEVQLLIKSNLKSIRASFGPALRNPEWAKVKPMDYFSIENGGRQYTIAQIGFDGIKLMQLVVVFDAKTGDLLFNSADVLANVTDATITSFGTDSDWFVWLQSWNPAVEPGGPLERRSCIIPIDGAFRCAVIADHFANDTAWTSTRQQAKAIGACGVFFMGKDGGTAIPKHRGKDSTGKKVIPALLWDSNRRKFIGPATASMKGITVMRVNVAESANFVEAETDSIATLILSADNAPDEQTDGREPE